MATFDNRVSGWAKAWLVIGSIAAIFLTAYIAWTINTYVYAAAPQVPAPALPHQSAETLSLPKATWDQIQRELAVLQRYSALVEYMQIFIPVFSFTLFTGLVGIGYYFVSAQVASAKYDAYKDANDKVASAAIALENAQKGYQDLEKRLRNFIEHKVDVALYGVEHALGLLHWKTRDYDDAIHHADTALNRIIKSLSRASELDPGSVQIIKDWRATAESTLGYYYAERYVKTKSAEDGKRAIELARRLPISMPAAAPDDILSLIDNYLYALVRCGQPLLGSDCKQLVKWMDEFGEQIKGYRAGPGASPEDGAFHADLLALDKKCRGT
jgi:tetratricopeptide (TPR) repeat protein